MSLRERLNDALQTSIDNCARCKVCDNQLDVIMPIITREINLRVRLARRRDLLARMEETSAPKIVIAEQRRMVQETEQQLGDLYE